MNRDELVLVCDLAARKGWRTPPPGDRETAEVSDLLRSLPLHSRETRDALFRSPKAVRAKVGRIVAWRTEHNREPVRSVGPEAREGRLLERGHLSRERDPGLRREKVAAVLAAHGCLECEACGFDFHRSYGERGNGYAEVHHVVPLHESGETTTRLSDLAVLCADCHRMVHRGKRWLTVAELRDLVHGQRR